MREGISNGLGRPGLPCSRLRGFPPAAALSLSRAAEADIMEPLSSKETQS